MSNFTNLMFRGYSMINRDLDMIAEEALGFAKALEHEFTFPVEDVRKAVEFICLSEAAQKHIWPVEWRKATDPYPRDGLADD